MDLNPEPRMRTNLRVFAALVLPVLGRDRGHRLGHRLGRPLVPSFVDRGRSGLDRVGPPEMVDLVSGRVVAATVLLLKRDFKAQ